MTSTKSSAHADRKRAAPGTAAAALLDELDATCLKRDKSEGEVGNLRGKLRAAEEALNAELGNFTRLEAKAARLRQSFHILTQGADYETSDENLEAFARAEADEPVVGEQVFATEAEAARERDVNDFFQEGTGVDPELPPANPSLMSPLEAQLVKSLGPAPK